NYENFQHLLHAFKVNTENIETVYQLAKIKSNFQQVLKDPNRIKDTKEIKIDIEYNLLKNINQIQNLTEKPTLINDTNSILELLSSNDIQQLPKEYQSKFYNLIKYIDSELVRIDNNSFQYQQDESYDRMLKKVDEKTYDQDKVIDLKVKLNVITDLLVYKLTQILSTDYQEKTKDIDKDKDTLLAA
ncbi:hypothetical protein KJ855_03560, partial [Patescibacteria group bacterium]|nr:hypothetical protein [Patescibacteria group bacterium]